MLKGFFILILVSLATLNFSINSFAQMKCMGMAKASAEETTTESTKEAVDIGNKICPVSGEEIKEEEKYQVEHEGKIYNFCCAMCIDEFKKDPERYIKKIEEELQTQTKEEVKEETTSEAPTHEGMHEGHHH